MALSPCWLHASSPCRINDCPNPFIYSENPTLFLHRASSRRLWSDSAGDDFRHRNAKGKDQGSAARVAQPPPLYHHAISSSPPPSTSQHRLPPHSLSAPTARAYPGPASTAPPRARNSRPPGHGPNSPVVDAMEFFLHHRPLLLSTVKGIHLSIFLFNI